MTVPGEYVPDVTEGIRRVEDLPKANIKRYSRTYKKRPCPYCGHSSYRDKVFTRTLHDLGALPSPWKASQCHMAHIWKRICGIMRPSSMLVKHLIPT